MDPVTRRSIALLLLAGAVLWSCRREEEPPPEYPPGGAAPGQWPGPTSPAPTWPGPTAALPGGAAAAPPMPGLPCASDADFQCPFGRCIAGRCGGCASSSDCKAGSCAPTPLGMACLGGLLPAPTASIPGAPPPWPGPAPTGAPPAPGMPPASLPGDAFAAAREQCVQRTNAYRAGVGAPPLGRRTASERCNDQQAQSDAGSGRAHGAFGQCGEWAQNECPGWSGSPDSMIAGCLDSMFAEGPGEGAAHGHYRNMTSTRYTAVSCGFFVGPGGRVWMIQDFY